MLSRAQGEAAWITNPYWQRVRTQSGIGWPFIRYTVIAMGIPTIGILALTGSLAGEASTLIAAAMAYAFGKSGDKDS